MKKKIVKVISVIIGIVILILGFFAYFVLQSKSGIVYDGLGRKLSEAPIIFKIILNVDYWAGFYWHIVDIIVFFGGAYLIFKINSKKN